MPKKPDNDQQAEIPETLPTLDECSQTVDALGAEVENYRSQLDAVLDDAKRIRGDLAVAQRALTTWLRHQRKVRRLAKQVALAGVD